jgi:hypothetical protein
MLTFSGLLEDLANFLVISYMEVPIIFKRCLSLIPLLSLRYHELTHVVWAEHKGSFE